MRTTTRTRQIPVIPLTAFGVIFLLFWWKTGYWWAGPLVLAGGAVVGLMWGGALRGGSR